MSGRRGGGGGREPAREWKAIFQDGGFAARRMRKGRVGLDWGVFKWELCVDGIVWEDVDGNGIGGQP